jgi:pSer/pThr/pTyr-binding forkhead associated (FHA) protein
MVQFDILSGKMAGTQWVARHFPVRIGRETASDLRLEESGVWERHAQLDLDPAQGYLIRTQGDALMSVNGQTNSVARLRNGDTVILGSAQLRFWLANASRRNISVREAFVWFLIASITLAQIVVIYQLLK